MGNPLVSVIIPCYNHGKFVDEAIDSVLAQTYKDIEIIVVNDGSEDEFTNTHLKNLRKPKTKVITTTNQGLPSARNNGIKEAKGKYILPLDADDKINSKYIAKAVDIIETTENIGIVYGKTEFFGDMSGVWDLPTFSFPDILLQNVIVCTSLFRRADWEKVGGYNKNMIYGFEDLDFWISLLELKREVVHIPEVMFYYRKILKDTGRKHSIADAVGSLEKIIYSFTTLTKNHPNIYRENTEYLVKRFFEKEDEKEEIRKLVVQRDHIIIDLNHQIKILEASNKAKEQRLRLVNERVDWLRLSNLPRRAINKIKRTLGLRAT